MPEGPETRIYSDQLSSLLGARFSSDCDSPIRHETHIKWGHPILTGVHKIGRHRVLGERMDEIIGSACDEISHHGKVSRFVWRNGRPMFVAYGMTGSWSLERNQYSRVEFVFDGGRHLFFQDVRKFGRIGIKDCDARLSKIGASIFGRDFTREELPKLKARFGHRTIRSFLLDPSICPGVGNYVCNEALWYAKECPRRAVNLMTIGELSKVVDFCRAVYRSSLEAGGVTLSDFCRIDGSHGSYQNKIKCYRAKVCVRCNSPIMRLKDGASSMYWCPVCAPMRQVRDAHPNEHATEANAEADLRR